MPISASSTGLTRIAEENSTLSGLVKCLDANESDADISSRRIRIVGRHVDAATLGVIEVDLSRTFFPRNSRGRVLSLGRNRRREHRDRRGGGSDN